MNSIIVSVIFVVIISPAFSLECYKCDSSQSMVCNVGLASFVMPTEDCSKQTGDDAANFLTSWVPKQCVKITAKDNEGKEFVARGCIPYSGGACNVVIKTLGFFSGLAGGASNVNCYTCDGDKCNSSFNIRPSLVAILVLSILSSILKL